MIDRPPKECFLLSLLLLLLKFNAVHDIPTQFNTHYFLQKLNVKLGILTWDFEHKNYKQHHTILKLSTSSSNKIHIGTIYTLDRLKRLDKIKIGLSVQLVLVIWILEYKLYLQKTVGKRILSWLHLIQLFFLRYLKVFQKCLSSVESGKIKNSKIEISVHRMIKTKRFKDLPLVIDFPTTRIHREDARFSRNFTFSFRSNLYSKISEIFMTISHKSRTFNQKWEKDSFLPKHFSLFKSQSNNNSFILLKLFRWSI